MFNLNSEDSILLANRLRDLKTSYYGGNPEVSDEEFDALEDHLRSIDPSNSYFSEVGIRPTGEKRKKVAHSIPMGSLLKAKDPEEIKLWVDRMRYGGKTSMVVSAKIDGLSVSIQYDRGKIVQALTRGNGIIGEDITDRVILMRGLPRVPGFTGFIRGEIVLPIADHKVMPQYKSRRNAAVGLARREGNEADTSKLTVVSYNIVGYGSGLNARSLEFLALKKLGFTIPYLGIADLEDVFDLYEYWVNGGGRNSYPYDTDGLVVEIDDLGMYSEMGVVDGRPKAARALKFPPESAETVLRRVVWQVGASGRVTPVALFDSVRISGADISQATFHNTKRILDLSVACGDVVRITRRGDVIPHVESVVFRPPDRVAIDVPKSCPSCFSSLEVDGEYLVCRNLGCPSQSVGRASRWLTQLGVLDWGTAVLEALIVGNQYVREYPANLYDLSVEDLSNTEVGGRKLGASAATRMIRNLRSRTEVSLVDFVTGLSIDLCGQSTIQTIVDAGYTTLESMEAAEVKDLERIPGVGKERASALVSGLESRARVICDLLSVGITIKSPMISGPLVGKSFCFTGFRDKDLEATIKSSGGVVKSGVSRGLSYLVMASVDSTSVKAQKARQYGTELITSDDVLRLIDEGTVIV